MVPVLVMLPVRLVLARIPVALLAPLIAIMPSFLTLSLLLMVTAAPLVGLTDPVELIRISSLAVPVRTGVVTAVLTTVSAKAGMALSARATGVRAVAASRQRIEFVPLFQARVSKPGTMVGPC